MTDTDKPDVLRPADDVHCWLERQSSVMLKAVTRFGDPVELTADQARDIATALLALAEQLEPQTTLTAGVLEPEPGLFK